MEPVNLRDRELPAVLAVVRLGTVTLEDEADGGHFSYGWAQGG